MKIIDLAYLTALLLIIKQTKQMNLVHLDFSKTNSNLNELFNNQITNFAFDEAAWLPRNQTNIEQTILHRLTYQDFNLLSNSNFIKSNRNHKSDFDLSQRVYNTDITSRNIKFIISEETECSVIIKDLIHFAKRNGSINYAQNKIIRSDAEKIIPRSIASDDVNINFTLFNKLLEVFSIYYDELPQKNLTRTYFPKLRAELNEALTGPLSESAFNQGLVKDSDFDSKPPSPTHFDSEPKGNSTNFAITFSYEAYGLIKSKRNQSTFQRPEVLTNALVWKLMNENNLNNQSISVEIEIYFDLNQHNFGNHVYFNLPFEKQQLHQADEQAKKVYSFRWKGELNSQESLILSVEFPHIFTQCDYVSFNVAFAVLGSVAIIFFVVILYVVSSILTCGQF